MSSERERSRFPNLFLKSSKLNSKAVFGAVWGILEFRQVFANERLAMNRAHRGHWRYPCIRKAHECVSHDELRREASEGEGARSPLFAIRCHLPLRGKLGWTTPRVGVKTALTTKRTLRGPRSQAGASFSSKAQFRSGQTSLAFSVAPVLGRGLGPPLGLAIPKPHPHLSHSPN